MKWRAVSLRQNIGSVVGRSNPLEVHNSFVHELSHVMILRADVFGPLPLDRISDEGLRTLRIRIDLHRIPLPIKTQLTQDIDVVFSRPLCVTAGDVFGFTA